MHMNPELKAILEGVKASNDHLMIEAVAGSGKTTTLLKICETFERGRSVQFLAYNRHIAQELKSRVPSHVFVNTSHSMGLSLVKKALGRKIEVDDRKYPEWIDKGLKEALEKGTFFKVQVSPEARGLLRTLKRAELGNLARDLNQVFGFVANQTTRPAAVDVEHALERISIVVPIDASEIAVWLGRLIDAGVWDAKENGRLGFIDMLLLPACWNLKPNACQVLLVDEFQDLTPLQFELVRKSAEQGARIVLVGDSNQSIYGFAGATGNAFEWVRQLPGNVRSFGLPFSWRCARAIVRKANGIVPTIRPAESAPEGIVQEVSLKEMYEAVKPGDLVLSRFNAPLIRIFLGLLSRSVPVLLRGNDIEKSLVRALREIGESSGFAYSGFDLFASRWFDAKVEKARGNRALIRSLEDNFEAVGICHATFRAESIFELITQVQKVFGDMRKDEEDRRITNDVIWLSSIHRSKGLQAKRVWVMDGKELPLRGPGMSRAEIETENNVAYVAFTRAQTFLGLVSTDAGANEGRR